MAKNILQNRNMEFLRNLVLLSFLGHLAFLNERYWSKNGTDTIFSIFFFSGKLLSIEYLFVFSTLTIAPILVLVVLKI